MPSPSGSTTHYGFAYLLESDAPDVATASQDLAVELDTALYSTNTNVATAAAELALLNTKVGLLNTGGPLAGSAPAATSPVFSIQGGSFSQTTGSGAAAGQVTCTFPTAFPAGLLTIVAINGDISVGNFSVAGAYTASPASRSSILLVCTNNATGSPLSSTGVRINYIAIGW